jgi:hypothetical protein
VNAKQIEIAQRYGVDPATLFPEPEPLPPELFPKKIGWELRKEVDRYSIVDAGGATAGTFRPSEAW